MPLECPSSATMSQPSEPPQPVLCTADGDPDPEPTLEPLIATPPSSDEPDLASIGEEIAEEILDSVFETLEPKSKDEVCVKEPQGNLLLRLARRICFTGDSTTATNGRQKPQTKLILVLLVLGLVLIEWLVQSLSK